MTGIYTKVYNLLESNRVFVGFVVFPLYTAANRLNVIEVVSIFRGCVQMHKNGWHLYEQKTWITVGYSSKDR